jgi:hypothetical protein
MRFLIVSSNLISSFDLKNILYFFIEDPFYALLTELYAYIANFEISTELIKIIKNYINRISNHLKFNFVCSDNNVKMFSIIINDVSLTI